jgi:hypothetical protein
MPFPSGTGLLAKSEVQETVVTFEGMASRYDDLFLHSRDGTQRGAVWAALADIFQRGDAILAVNCRMQDARFLGLLDVSVAGRDIAENAKFDGVLANFSGSHSVTDLGPLACELASLVNRGGPVVVCVSSRFCLLETLWFVFHGRFRKAFRRSFGVATVRCGQRAMKLGYPTWREITRAFSPFFIMRSCMGIGVTVPPSYLEPIFWKYPRMLRLLHVVEKSICHVRFIQRMGDHTLLHFERV